MKIVILAEKDRYIILVEVVMRADETCGVESEEANYNASTYLIPIDVYALNLRSNTTNK